VRSIVLLDTGPLVAFLRRRDRYHHWALEQFRRIDPPMYTCEAVLAEACHLLAAWPGGSESVLKMVETGALKIDFHLQDEFDSIRTLMTRYRTIPMSLADACLVRMSELNTSGKILTLDSDFLIYRKHGRQNVPVIFPRKD